jgi:hypothetical protein
MRGPWWISILGLALMLSACLPQPVRDMTDVITIRDSFTGGKPELAWRPYPYFNKDTLKGAIDRSSPEGEPGVGVLDNRNAGGFAALSYADTPPLAGFHLETWLHVQVSAEEKGALNGIASIPSRTSTTASRRSSPPRRRCRWPTSAKTRATIRLSWRSGRARIFPAARRSGAVGIASRSR